MNTIRYSFAFDCLILEREGGNLYYFRDWDRLLRTLKYFADQDREAIAEADTRIPQETAKFLAEQWVKQGNVLKTELKLEELEIEI